MLDGKNNDLSLLSSLGTKLYYFANSAKTNCIVLPTNMAALSRGCKPRIVSLASSNETKSTEQKSKTSMNGNEIFWVLVNNLRPGVLFSSA